MVTEGIYTGVVPDTSKWQREDPDSKRGKPFKRWLRSSGRIQEVVHVPAQLDDQRWIRTVWQMFPQLLAWHADSGESRPYRYGWIIFVKTGWSGEVDR